MLAAVRDTRSQEPNRFGLVCTDALMPSSHRSPQLISVIIPALNSAGTLPQQLAALAAQDYAGDWEVVVADNGSIDGTVEVARAWGDCLPSLRVVDARTQRGSGFARNRAAGEAHGDYFAFCDSDDVVEPGWLTALAEAGLQADLVAGVFDEDSLNDPVARWWVPRPRSDARLGRHLGFLPFGRASNLGIRANVFHALGGFDDSYSSGDDAVLCWRAQLEGFSIGLAPEAVVAYRFRSTLSGVLRQAFSSGRVDVRLYRDFRHDGLRRPALRKALKGWAWLVVRFPAALVSRRWRGRWVRALGYRIGRLAGSARYRVVMP